VAEFCTLFDRNYLARGLVLYRSLVEVGAEFTLRVFAMDRATAEILGKLALPNIEIVPEAELESIDHELAAIRGSRSHVEFLWTATPAICLASLERDPGLDEITYLDADLMFFSDPAPIFEEIADSSITIIEHRYAPRWKSYEALSGIYNVEWLTFRRDRSGLEALRWWRERCLEWCRTVPEDGKFGDQAYLDDWPDRFQGVHVLEVLGAGVAPWNVESYRVERDSVDRVLVDGEPLVFFHHHGVRLIRSSGLLERVGLATRVFERTDDGPRSIRWRSGYPVRPFEKAMIWDPYMRRIMDAFELIRTVDPSFDSGFVAADPREVAWVTRANLGRLVRPR
jgi:hypothetical protein